LKAPLSEYLNALSSGDDASLPQGITSKLDSEIKRVNEIIERKAQPESMSTSSAIIDQQQDILTQPFTFWETKVGHILDAQDYLESWYLAIVVDADIGPGDGGFKENNANRKIHYLPFKNSKRDEILSSVDSQHKLAPAFTQSEKLGEAGKAIGALRDYLKWYQEQENLERVQRHEVATEQKTDEISQMGIPAVLTPPSVLFQGPNPFAGLLGASV
jgi:hypothetical protein